jgi:2-oxoglutarate ferredoxin oxidoreductase subunit gamma
MGEEIQVRFAGTGGQGLQLSARILAEALLREGRIVAFSQSYEPTSRGGLSRSDLIIGDAAIDFPLVTALDLLVALDQLAMPSCLSLIKPDGVILADSDRVQSPISCSGTFHMLPLTAAARCLGNERVANAVALGALAYFSGLCSRMSLEASLKQEIPTKFLDLNLVAVSAGYRLAEDHRSALLNI